MHLIEILGKMTWLNLIAKLFNREEKILKTFSWNPIDKLNCNWVRFKKSIEKDADFRVSHSKNISFSILPWNLEK